MRIVLTARRLRHRTPHTDGHPRTPARPTFAHLQAHSSKHARATNRRLGHDHTSRNRDLSRLGGANTTLTERVRALRVHRGEGNTFHEGRTEGGKEP